MSIVKRLLLAFVISLTCFSVSGQEKPLARKDLIGYYARNLAQGWTRYTEADGTEVEVIPELPRMQYLQLKRGGKFTFRYGSDPPQMAYSGKWRLRKDTLSLYQEQITILESGKEQKNNWTTEYYVNYACQLISANPNERSYYRTEPPCN